LIVGILKEPKIIFIFIFFLNLSGCESVRVREKIVLHSVQSTSNAVVEYYYYHYFVLERGCCCYFWQLKNKILFLFGMVGTRS